MKQGDFTKLAAAYVNRPGYSTTVMKFLTSYVSAGKQDFVVADVGAGTGKLTEILLELGLTIHAVEPNDAMRAEGIRLFGHHPSVSWHQGSAEQTGLASASVDWVLMASSFHWTDKPRALQEFHRLLKPGGFLTVLWNPRDLENSELQKTIDAKIHEMVPHMTRVSSGSSKYTDGIEKTLLSTRQFKDVLFVEAPHEEHMTRERYMNVWRSVNDIQAQAGEKKFQEILAMIGGEIAHLDTVAVAYKTRSWTVQSYEV